MVSYWLPRRLGCLHRLAVHEMEAPDTYRRRAEIADRAADAAADDEARRILMSVAQRWRQLAEIAQRESRAPSLWGVKVASPWPTR